MKLNYRPAIDGLRALAVISVLIYHAKFEIFGFIIFKGGYIGVDIFFVISGYLITRLILFEKLILERFSFVNFYERRLRRLLPVLLVVVISIYPFITYFYLPIDLNNFINSINYTLIFISNFFFHYSGIEYGGTSSLLKPLLHTWSLSIEEQFYIFFPFIFVILLNFKKKILFFFISIGIILSLLASIYLANNHPSFNFYMLVSRIWELLVGSLIALYFFYSKKNFLSPHEKKIGIFGLCLIIFSIFFFNENTKHPSLITLLPIIGTSLIILSSKKENIITKFLSNKNLVFLGLISYSLYLWHYPIFAIARYNNLFENNFIKLVLIFLSLFLSIFSFYFIEKKFRDFKAISRKKFYLFLALMLLIILSAFNYSLNYKIKNLPKDLVSFDYRPWQKLRNDNLKICHNSEKFCKFIKKEEYPNIYILGDSHASILMNGIKKEFVDKNKFNLITTTSSCFGMPDFNFFKENQIIQDPCNSKHYKKILKTISATKNNIIIISARFPLYLSNGKYFDNRQGDIERNGDKFYQLKSNNNITSVEQGYLNFFDKLNKISKKIIVVYPVPEVGFNVPRRIFNLIKEKKLDNLNNARNMKNLTTSYEVYLNRTRKSFNLLNKLNYDISRIYPHKIFCDKERCFTVLNNQILYSDNNHLSLSGSKLINEMIINEIKRLNF